MLKNIKPFSRELIDCLLAFCFYVIGFSLALFREIGKGKILCGKFNDLHKKTKYTPEKY